MVRWCHPLQGAGRRRREPPRHHRRSSEALVVWGGTTVEVTARGDHTPGGGFLDLIEERVSGPHPRFSMSDEEFCAVVTPLLA
jgi:hypothetical protein